MNLKNRFNRGFTLIELLVVIAIIGILSSVVLASLNNARVKSRDARRTADLSQLQVALELYYDSNNQEYPDTLAALATGGFIPKVPTDPQNNSAYLYAPLGSTGNCTDYHLAAVMENTVGDGNGNLNSDVDAAAGTACTTVADFHGNAASCSGTSAVADANDENCYDKTP